MTINFNKFTKIGKHLKKNGYSEVIVSDYTKKQSHIYLKLLNPNMKIYNDNGDYYFLTDIGLIKFYKSKSLIIS